MQRRPIIQPGPGCHNQRRKNKIQLNPLEYQTELGANCLCLSSIPAPPLLNKKITSNREFIFLISKRKFIGKDQLPEGIVGMRHNVARMPAIR
jgi:hypothetical protein